MAPRRGHGCGTARIRERSLECSDRSPERSERRARDAAVEPCAVAKMKVTRFTIHAALEPGMIKVYRLEIIGGVLERVCIMETGSHTENSVSTLSSKQKFLL